MNKANPWKQDFICRDFQENIKRREIRIARHSGRCVVGLRRRAMARLLHTTDPESLKFEAGKKFRERHPSVRIMDIEGRLISVHAD